MGWNWQEDVAAQEKNIDPEIRENLIFI